MISATFCDLIEVKLLYSGAEGDVFPIADWRKISSVRRPEDESRMSAQFRNEEVLSRE
jgi:hypothetical protein